MLYEVQEVQRISSLGVPNDSKETISHKYALPPKGEVRVTCLVTAQ
jgi:hypothetical protein